jgi:hypothetical protein
VVRERRNIPASCGSGCIHHIRKSAGDDFHGVLVQVDGDAMRVVLVKQAPRSKVVQPKECICVSMSQHLLAGGGGMCG